MKYLYFAGVLIISVFAIVYFDLVGHTGYLALIFGLMITIGIILTYNKNKDAKDVGWALCVAGLTVTLLFVAFLIWLTFSGIH